MTQLLWKPLGAEHKAELETLYNECFPVPAGGSFLDDFPIWTPGLSPAVRQWGAWDGSQLVSSASIRVGHLKDGGQKVGIIGGVVTHSSQRGQGLASQAVEKILADPISQDLAALFLWGSEPELYGKFGFEYGGIQYRASLSDIPVIANLPEETMIEEGFRDEFLELMRARPQGLAIAASDLEWMKRHENVVWASLRRGRRYTAFVGIGRGIDLAGMIHEFGGDGKDLLALLGALHSANPNLQLIYHPDLAAQFPFLSLIVNPIQERLFMAKINDPKIVLDSLWFYGMDSC